MKRARCLVAGPGLAVAVLAATPAAAALRGLIIGIDQYPGFGPQNQLSGAVNDARDIAQALVRAGAHDITLLVNGAASKSRISESWTNVIERAEPGDTIVLTYAGHGSQEPEPPGRDQESDGMNENFILGGFSPHGEKASERIVDDEMYEWLKMADDKGLKTVFVAIPATPAPCTAPSAPPTGCITASSPSRPSAMTNWFCRRRKTPRNA